MANLSPEDKCEALMDLTWTLFSEGLMDELWATHGYWMCWGLSYHPVGFALIVWPELSHAIMTGLSDFHFCSGAFNFIFRSLHSSFPNFWSVLSVLKCDWFCKLVRLFRMEARPSSLGHRWCLREMGVDDNIKPTVLLLKTNPQPLTTSHVHRVWAWAKHGESTVSPWDHVKDRGCLI